MSRIPQETIDAIVQEYQDGSSSTKLAKKYNHSISTIVHYLHAAGIEMRGFQSGMYKKPKILDDETRAKIVQEYGEGVASPLLAKKYHISCTTVTDYLREAGVEMRRSRDYDLSHEPYFTEEQMKKIIFMYEEMLYNAPAIAKEFYAHPTTIRAYLRKHGVKLRPRGGSNPRKISERARLEAAVVYNLYVNKGLTIKEIAEIMEINPSTLNSRMHAMGNFPFRTKSETLRNMYQKKRRVPNMPNQGAKKT